MTRLFFYGFIFCFFPVGAWSQDIIYLTNDSVLVEEIERIDSDNIYIKKSGGVKVVMKSNVRKIVFESGFEMIPPKKEVPPEIPDSSFHAMIPGAYLFLKNIDPKTINKKNRVQQSHIHPEERITILTKSGDQILGIVEGFSTNGIFISSDIVALKDIKFIISRAGKFDLFQKWEVYVIQPAIPK